MVTLITGIFNTLMGFSNMAVQSSWSVCFVITLVTWIPNTFMHRFVVLPQAAGLGFLIITFIAWVLSQPKLNPELSSTEFEVRLHSYIEIHHPPHKLNLYTQNWEELTTAQLARRDPLYKRTVTHRPVKQLCTTFSRPNFNFFQIKEF